MYIYGVCYINCLINRFWFSSFVPVDSSCHMMSFSNFDTSLFPANPFMQLLSKILHLYMYSPNDTNMYILLYMVFLKSVKRRKGKKCAFKLAYILTLTGAHHFFVSRLKLLSGMTFSLITFL